MVNCAVGEEMEEDDGDYYDGDWGNSDYLADRPLSRVNLADIDNNYSPIEIEFGDIGGWNTDREVWYYLENRNRPGDYRDSDRAGGCDAFKLFAKTNSARRPKGKWTGDKKACVAFTKIRKYVRKSPKETISE